MIKIAESLLGIPYKLHGRDQSGLDCLGLVIHFYGVLGKRIADPLSHNPEHVLSHEFYSQFTPIAEPEIGCGVDLALKGHPHHLGIWFGKRVLTTTKDTGVLMLPPRVFELKGFYRPNA